LRWRLSLLMFLLYAVPGAVQPLFTLHLQNLHFSELQISWAAAMQAVAALVAPLAGQFADRWWPAERCLAVCALVAAGCLWALAGLTDPLAVSLTVLAFWLVAVPIMTLGASLSFAHLAAAAERQYGSVRMWGTVGWMSTGVFLGFWLALPNATLSDIFRLGGVLAVVLACYTLTLPPTPPYRQVGSKLALLDALRLLGDRSFALYCVTAFGISVTFPFTIQLTSLLLRHLGLEQAAVSQTLPLAQTMEIASLALLPMLLLRLGLRDTMLLGLGAWVLALSILTLGRPLWLVISSLTLNGLMVSCFLVAGQVFVNRRARGHIRASAQALIVLVNGVGQLGGHLLVGGVRRLAGGAFGPTFGVAGIIAAVLLVVFFVGFVENDQAA
jgi:MFS family permease